jgi:hypothetical protein
MGWRQNIGRCQEYFFAFTARQPVLDSMIKNLLIFIGRYTGAE